MTYFILTVVWNIAAQGCFSAKVDCLWFHSLPFPSISVARMFYRWGFIHVTIQFPVQQGLVASRYFPLSSHTLCALQWVSFGQVIPGPLMVNSNFTHLIFFSNKTLFNCTTVEKKKKMFANNYYVFETASLYLMSWKILKPTALFSYCTWKSRLHAR